MPTSDITRTDALSSLMRTHTNRRSFLKAAAAAGLIPVLTTTTVQQRALAQDAQPKPGGTFITLGQDSIESLSPEDSGETVQWVGITQIFEGLYTMNENYELEPTLADSYEASTDGKTYTFKLKKGVTFHNGDAFTAKDVKYIYEWIMDKANASTRAESFALVDKVEAPDDTTIKVTLKESDVTFMVNVATAFIYPADAHKKATEAKFKQAPVGTGPYMLGELNPQSRVTLKAFDAYHNGKANIDVFQIDVVPEAAGRMSALESGKADNSIWSLNAEDNTKLKDSGKFTVYETTGNATNHFPLNNKHPFLKNKEVRQAMITGVDRKGFADEIFKGQAEVATSNLSPAIEKYYTKDVTIYDYDPDKANKMLDDAGWKAGSDEIREKDGVKAQFTMLTFQGDTLRRPEAEYAQEMWKEIGIQCDLQEGITSEILSKLVKGEADAGLFNWTYGGTGGDPDARDTLTTGGANNFSQYSNPDVDTLLNDGVRELDETKRIAIYQKVQEIIADDVPFIYLLLPKSVVFYTTRIKGLPTKALQTDYIYPKIYKAWIDG